MNEKDRQVLTPDLGFACLAREPGPISERAAGPAATVHSVGQTVTSTV